MKDLGKALDGATTDIGARRLAFNAVRAEADRGEHRFASALSRRLRL